MSGGGSFGLADLETSPVEFLSLAEDDFERGGLAALVNATANAKRAIVSQLDQLLTSFGYPSFRWNVPKKIERLALNVDFAQASGDLKVAGETGYV